MAKYTEVIKDMLEYNKDLFESFRVLEEKYNDDPATYQVEFNSEGEKVLRVVRRYENILCGKSESGRYGKFSSNLSEKYWQEIRRLFPHIDSVGVMS